MRLMNGFDVQGRLRRDESGIALVVALGVMLVVAIALAGVAQFVTMNQGSTKHTNARQDAFDLAEAGLNNALSVLANSSDPADASALPSGTKTLQNGTAAWSATLSGDTWTITGTGAVNNPSAPGTVTRQVRQRVQVTVSQTVWEWNYSESSAGCLSMAPNATFLSNLWVSGNMCLSNNAVFRGDRLHVSGTVTMGNGASLGLSTARLSYANLVGGCTNSPAGACTEAHRVYATTPPGITRTPGTFTKPPLEESKWPNQTCSSGTLTTSTFDPDGVWLTRSTSAFDLTPTTAYSCDVVSGTKLLGRLTWTPGNPGTLAVAGTIFFDRPLNITRSAVYTGKATIYSSGNVSFSTTSARLCGVTACDATWDTASNLIVFAAGSPTAQYGFFLSNNTIYQGAAYAVMDYRLSNNAQNWGPVIARNISVENNSGQNKPLSTLPPGAPGIETTIHVLPGTWTG